ncbi:MAG: hypothetical protein CMN85_10500 [Spongiibacteraceae bacterium]|nr:hypothetical protein [Spongiibacteraceae bacterium]
MLMEANHCDKKKLFNGALITIERGQMLFGLEAFSATSRISISKLRRFISLLEKEQMISRQKTNKYSVISIVNYDEYQIDDRQGDSQEAGKATGKRQANDKPAATPKEFKELQEDKPAEKTARNPVGIQTFIDECKAQGQKFLPPDDPIFDYTHETGIPDEFLKLCLLEFVERNKAAGKRQKNWRAAFRNCVRANWYKLWWLDGEEYLLTTTGKQAEIKHRKTGKAA